MSKRRRASRGMVPRAMSGLFAAARWLLRHPQPLIVIAAIALSVVGFNRVVRSHDAFAVANVELPPDSGLTIPDGLVGENMWSVDLNGLAEMFHVQQPSLAWVRVTRVLPRSLRVETEARRPIAQVQLGQWHAIDARGFIFPTATATPQDGLLALKGVDDRKAPLRVGRENISDRLAAGLKLAQSLAASSALHDHEVTSVDISNPQQITFIIDDGMEIRCGAQEELDGQLNRLRVVLQKVKRQAIEIRYIDVRFPDPVVSPKT